MSVVSNMDELLENLDRTRSWHKFYDRGTPRQWSFQRKIIRTLLNYFNETRSLKEPQAAVVKMPTGTGKTAIMTLVANFAHLCGNILIIVPSLALKSQVRDYLNHEHWLKCKLRPYVIKKAEYFEPSRISWLLDVLNQGDLQIPICTTKTIADLRFNYPTLYEALRESVDLIFVDEGHREPAKTWARAVRDLSKPVILFTATPYRNDFRFFNIGECRCEVTYQDALYKHKCIRDVNFIPDVIPYTKYEVSINGFVIRVPAYVSSLYTAIKEILPNSYISIPKIIVRCQTEKQIRQVKKEIEKTYSSELCGISLKPSGGEGKSRPLALGIHDTFKTNVERHEYDNLDSALKHASDTLFWIHQYKLMEGIDDPDFVLISFCAPYSNARSLVQQIGRVIRRPPRSKTTTAFVHTDTAYQCEQLWDGYLNYELSDKKLYGTEEVVHRIIDAFPDYFYFNKKFNRIISKNYNPDEIRELIEQDLQIPRITNVLKNPSGIFNLTDLLEKLSESLLDKDVIQIARGILPLISARGDGQAQIGVYIGFKIKASEYLTENLFFDINLVAYTLLVNGEFIFYRGDSIGWLQEEGLRLETVTPTQMQRLLGPDNPEKIKVKQASLIHSDPSRLTKRRRLEGGNDLYATAPYLGDHLHILSTLVCQRDGIPRYIGLNRGRLSDGRGSFVSVKEYFDWTNAIIEDLNTTDAIHGYFGRFAEHVDSPIESVPEHLLCDMTAFKEMLRQKEEELNPDAFQEAFDEISQPITNWDRNTASARIQLCLRSDQETKVPFVLNYKNGRYHLKPASKEAIQTIEDLFGKPVVSDLKRCILLRIITQERYFYVEDHFFNPSLPLWGSERINALGVFAGLNELRETEYEKEGALTNWHGLRTWPEQSVFAIADGLRNTRMVERLNAQCDGEEPFFVPEVLICDDAHGEIGDFILYSKELKKIVVIHAKQSSNPFSCSAVAFAKIAEQVIKNLRLFDPYIFSRQEIIGNLEGQWSDKEGDERLRRLRKPYRKSINNIVSDIKELLRTGATREVWVFYGKGFYIGNFLSELQKESPDYYYRHLAYILVNCNDAVARAGAKLRVFTSSNPEDE